LLLSAQQADGGWTGKYGSGVDTSFALLFLRRANLTRDLTAFLKGRDAMEVALRGGGVMERKNEEERNGEGTARPKIEDRRSKMEDRSGDNRSSILDPQSPKTNSPPPLTPSPITPSPPRPSPGSGSEAEAARLTDEFLKASGSKQEELLEHLKQTKGGAYTAALAAAIEKLNGPLKTKAREALAERLARMTAGTLRDMLHDESAEIRRAAALACAMKDEKEFVPELARLLEDEQPTVGRAAYSALKALTGQDFGPAANASSETRSRAAAAWKEWWQKQSGRRE
jgi:hypothetical protein